jgi:hypothetical protein
LHRRSSTPADRLLLRIPVEEPERVLDAGDDVIVIDVR